METQTDPMTAGSSLDAWLAPSRPASEPPAEGSGLPGTRRPRVIAGAVGLLAVGAPPTGAGGPPPA